MGNREGERERRRGEEEDRAGREGEEGEERDLHISQSVTAKGMDYTN